MTALPLSTGRETYGYRNLGSKASPLAASGLSVAAALAHLWAAPGHLLEWWGYGAFFLVAAFCQGAYAVLLLRWPGRRLSLAGIGGNLALVSFYAVTRTAGIPFFGPHAGEVHAVGALDAACVAAELALVVVLVARAGALPAAGRYLAPAVLQAFGVGSVMHLLRLGAHGAHGSDPAVQWLQATLFAVPLSVLLLWLAATPSRRLIVLLYGGPAGAFPRRLAWALTGAAACAAGSLASGTASGRDAGVVLGATFLVLLVSSALRGVPWEEPRPIDHRRPRTLTAAAGAAVGLAVLAGPTVLGAPLPSPAQAQQAAGQCNAASYDRSYDVAAANVDVPYNRWGGLDPHGQVFVLQNDEQAMKNWWVELGPTPAEDPAGAENRRLRPRPLVVRANAGECVKVTLTNELDVAGGDGLPNDPRVGIKVYGPAYDAQTSDGSAVGYNADTTVGRGETISYFWEAPNEEGTFLFRDQGAMSGSEANSGTTAHGLYGAFVVEPAGSTWTDPETGLPLYRGDANHDGITKESGDPYIDADVRPAQGEAFRETVQISQDELPGGNGFGFNYGAEPGFNRIATNPAGEGNAEQLAPDAIGEETSLSSWTFGDPALIKLASGKGPWLPEPDPDNPGSRISAEDCGLQERPGGSCYVSNVTHAYPGDPTKIRFAHAGVKETHVFHMHAHQWLAEPNDAGGSGAPSGGITDANRPDSTTIDSQTYGPGESFTAELLYGAGSRTGTVGDSIFHCHLYPHFADGFWALFRVHDVREDGSGETPDGVKVRNLEPLSQAPPQPTADNPGYPRFIPGKFGWRAPQPPDGISEPSGTDDLPSTLEREDLTAAARVVAGRPLDSTLDPTDDLEKELADKLAVEQSVQERGAAPVPGAPFADPCPAGSREVTYNVSVVQADVTYNEAGWHDKQGRVLVLDKDVDEVLAGKNPEPLFIRVNAGDCVNFNLTNRLPNWFGDDEFTKLAQTNMVGEHIHLVKFDVLGSDGSSNGWNYQQAAFTGEQAAFNKDLDADGNVKNCDWGGCRVPDPDTWDPSQAGSRPGQTVHERWYADYELRTVFTHDHHFPALDQNRGLFGAMIVEPEGMDFRNPKTGEFYAPVNDPANGEPCGDRCEGAASGTAMDVIGPSGGDDFREFGLAVQDFVSLHESDEEGGAPIEAPGAPEAFPDDDPGVMGINYRNAPFVLRDEDKNGRAADPAHVFSSTVHGDPATPVLQAYSEDPVRMRLIQGSQEEQHVFSVNGVNWRQEPDDPESPMVNSQAVGISEAFNFEVPKITCGTNDRACAGDYLYSGTSTDDMYLGVWGLLRARGEEVPSLLPLPDNVPRAAGEPLSVQSAPAPPEANSPGTPCPAGSPTREYDVVALQADLRYNKDGDHDPNGLIYALARPGESPAETAARVRAQDEHEPLVLRANEGDCLQVRLTNKLTAAWLDGHENAGTDGDPTLPTEPATGTPAGLRVSLHPQLVEYDVRGSDGTAVGFNRDQTVGPDDSILYRWYAKDTGPGEAGATNLTDFGDVRGHRHHGLFAGLNIEPRGSTYHDPQTGAEIESGASADVVVPGPANDFREFTTFFQDGLNLYDATDTPIEDPLDHPPTPEEPAGHGLDAEDQGEKGFNYASSPFVHRIGEVPESGMDGHEMAHVFDSGAHGDPDTPIFRALAGDDIRMRVLQGSDKPRQHSFQVSGASWKAQPGDPGSTRIGTQGGISVGRSNNLHLSGFDAPGDYRYGCGVGFHHLSGGLWGLLRVYPQPADAMRPTPIPGIDDPLAGGHPVLPLETSEVATRLNLAAKPGTVDRGKTTTLSGSLLADGRDLAGRTIVLERRPAGANGFARLDSGRTGKGGEFLFARVKPRETTTYRVRFAGDARVGMNPSTSNTKRVIVRGS